MLHLHIYVKRSPVGFHVTIRPSSIRQSAGLRPGALSSAIREHIQGVTDSKAGRYSLHRAATLSGQLAARLGRRFPEAWVKFHRRPLSLERTLLSISMTFVWSFACGCLSVCDRRADASGISCVQGRDLLQKQHGDRAAGDYPHRCSRNDMKYCRFVLRGPWLRLVHQKAQISKEA